jgi:hypothetical protein
MIVRGFVNLPMPAFISNWIAQAKNSEYFYDIKPGL